MKMDKTVSNLSEKLKETETLRRLERVRPREGVRPLGKRGKIATAPFCLTALPLAVNSRNSKNIKFSCARGKSQKYTCHEETL